MGQFISSNKNEEGDVLEKVINSIKSEEIKNVVIMCGAGISTSAGIPDFRSPSTGLYFKLRKYNLPFPEAIFEGKALTITSFCKKTLARNFFLAV